MDEKEEKSKMEAEKQSVWFEGKRDLFEPDEAEKRAQEHQAILRKHLEDTEGPQSYFEDYVDKMPIKSKKKWRIW